MKKILFITRPLLGQIIPSLGIAKELANRGVVVHFATHSCFASFIKNEGIGFVASKVSMVSFEDKSIFENLAEEVQYELRDTDATFHEALNYLENTNYDLLAVDSTMPGPAYAAEKLGMPWISLGFSAHVHKDEVYGSPQSYKIIQMFMMRSLNNLRKTYGLPPLTSRIRSKPEYFGLSPKLHLFTSLKELEKDPSVFPSSTVFVGPTEIKGDTQNNDLIPLTAFLSKNDDRPLILVSTPSEDKPFFRGNSEKYLDTVIQAFVGKRYRVIITCSPALSVNHDLDYLENIRILSTASPVHSQLISKIDYLIFHGGNGTFYRALRNAIPMIIIPNGFDAYAVANRCVNNNLGIMIDPKGFTKESLFNAIECLEKDTQYKSQCNMFSEILKSKKGNEEAANRIIEFLCV